MKLELTETMHRLFPVSSHGFDVPRPISLPQSCLHEMIDLYEAAGNAGFYASPVDPSMICIDEHTYMTKKMLNDLIERVKLKKLIYGTASIGF